MRVLAELRILLRIRDFRRLFTIRVVSQSADGMFQAGLATLFFFSPERASSAGQVAIAFAVLLAPFTIVGPWAGVFLDRWRRRQVLLVGNLVRAALSLVIGGLMLATPVGEDLGVGIYVLALVNLSINRFLLSALSAGLPRIVDGPLLLTANSLLPTLGAVSAGGGAGLGLLPGLVAPSGRVKDAAAGVVAALLMAGASALALRLARDRLGPEEPDRTPVREAFGVMARDLLAGARYLVRRGTPGQALVVMSLHRFLFGMTMVYGILLAKNYLAPPSDSSGGLAAFAQIGAATGLGFAAAVVLSPTVGAQLGQRRWILVCLGLGAFAQGALAVHVSLPMMLVAGAALGLSSQGAKIAVDTIVQRDTADDFRGRAFALYDVLYNTGLVGAAALAAVALPDDGYSRPLYAVLAVTYVVVASVYGLRGARAPHPTP
ncbi:MFS transporter [Sanguibacter massiliensis]|uniref:MFS transporter n=1 Tax=Sanguibacter massiliensis TaxID=1973217 RepID=UPI000C85F156|nr:MFS transporter [Sanguibacter massiliensis]